MQQFAIDATAFGLLASTYYYGYAGMQIPIAIMLDRFGTRCIIFSCALICGITTLIFTFASNWYLALLSRFLIGIGSAVGFLGTSKVISQWFTKDQYTRMVGFSFTIGLMGAIYGGKPISLLVESFNWQNVALTLSLVSITIGILTYLLLRNPTHNRNKAQDQLKFKDFKKLLSLPTIWLLGLANCLMVGILEGFADVWGVNYLMAAYDISKSSAAELTSYIFIGMLFGGPLLALLSKRFGNYTIISGCGLGMAIIFLLLIYVTNYNWQLLAMLFFIAGLMCCYQVIVFSAGCDLVTPQLLGVTIAFLNCMNMLGGSFFHTLIGYMMDAFWTGNIGDDGTRQYTLESYNLALMVIPTCAILGAAMVGFIGLQNFTKKKTLNQMHLQTQKHHAR